MDHWRLLVTLVERELAARTRGSFLGPFWLLVRPAGYLLVFTFVFGVLLAERWEVGPEQGLAELAVFLFAGLSAFHFVAERLNAAPNAMLKRRAMLKQAAFPLWLMPLTEVIVSAVAFGLALGVLLVGALLAGVSPALEWLLLPLLVAPILLLMVGLAWTLAAFGVYLRDLRHALAPITQMLLFLSPIFYSLDSLPDPYRSWLFANPVTVLVEIVRPVVIQGSLPSGLLVLACWTAAIAMAWIGIHLFRRLEPGFADVL